MYSAVKFCFLHANLAKNKTNNWLLDFLATWSKVELLSCISHKPRRVMRWNLQKWQCLVGVALALSVRLSKVLNAV